MRASATSRISHHAAAHAAQGHAHAPKTDEASPFALLVASAAKPPQHKDSQADTGRQDDKQDVSAADRKTTAKSDSKSAAADDKTAAQADKTGKADKPGQSDDKSDDKAAASDTAAELPQPDAQPAPQAPPLQFAVNNAASDEGTDETAPVGEAAKPSQPAAPHADATKADATKADVKADATKAALPKDQQAGNDVKAARPGKADADDAKAGKSDKADAKSADAKPDAAAEFAKAAQDAPKPAPQAANGAANANSAGANPVTANMAAAPSAQAPAANPILAQHVEVKAQAPAPDLPKLGVEIAARSQSGLRQFDIRLDPPELGRVEVRLSIDATGKASAHLSADQPQTLDLLQKDATGLTRALRDAGLNVSQDGLNFSLRQQAGGSQEQGGRNTSRGAALSLHAARNIEPAAAIPVIRAAAHGRVDISV